MAGENIPGPTVAESRVEDYFSWDGDAVFRELARALAWREDENTGEDAGPSHELKSQCESVGYEFYSDSEYEDEYEEDYYDDSWLFLSPDQRAKIQNWIDEQPNSYWSANIPTPRSPPGIPPRPFWARSDRGSEPDLENGPFRDGALVMEEANRDGDSQEVGGSSAGCNYAYCGRCGAYLGMAAGPAGREWSAGKVVLCAVGTVVAVLWARSVWVNLSSYHT